MLDSSEFQIPTAFGLKFFNLTPTLCEKTSFSVKMASALIYPKKGLFAVNVATSGKAQIFAQTPLVARISIQIEPCQKFAGSMVGVTMKMMIFYVIAMEKV